MNHSNCHYRNARSIASNDSEKYLRSEIYFLAIAKEGSICLNYQSCDCDEVILCTNNGYLLVTHEKVPYQDAYGEDERIFLYSIDSYHTDYYSLKIVPSVNETICFKRALYDENGVLTSVKFLFGSRFLYFFVTEGNLIVTKSCNELFDEEWVSGQSIVEEDSVLFS